MKKNLFFSLLAASAMMVSCSSEDAVESSNGNVEGEGYISLAINLPSVSGTRAANDVYSDGTANEYAVNDATLVLFEGTDEASATLSTAYNLNLNFSNSSDDNITTTAQIVQKINDPLASGSKFYALVILNNNGQLVVNTDNTLTVNGASVTGKKLADFIKDTKISTSTTQLYDNVNVKNFFMSNAPLYTAVGGATLPAGSVQTLAEIDGSKVYETQAQAAANPATTINVERAVAKVTLASTASGKLTGANKLDYTILGWQLDNTNTDSYLVRNVANGSSWWTLASNTTPALSKPYRFVGDAAVVSGLYRTYWGEDPNYSATDGSGMTYWDENSSVTWLTAGTTDIAYCAENTFDVAHQKDVNSTTAIVKVQFNGGADFYTINNSSSTLYSEANLIKAIKASFISNTAIANAVSPLLSTTLDEGGLDVTLSSTVAGMVTITSIKVLGTYLTSGTDRDASTITVGGSNATALVNAANTIRLYKGGIAYYPVIIKHFGDDLTPWRNGETVAPSAGTIYPAANADANYLGRYGVLRNNWYDIQVTAIKELGTATVPTLGTTPGTSDDPEGPGNGGYDDDIDQYIAVKINILSWAKRTQSVTL